MGFINPFQIYSKGENTITNNILLLLSNLYRINPKIYELFINSILPENINYQVIPVFTQQKSQKEGGIIDGHIQTKATKIIIETKVTGLANTKKLINYCKNENPSETNILIHRGYSNHQFTGIYTAKEVKYIGKVNKVFLAELTEEGTLITKKISGNGEITSEEENRIINTIREFPEIYIYGDISKGHIFFLFDDNDFCPIEFKKLTSRGLRKNKYYELKSLLNIENIENSSTLEIAEKLNDITW